MAIIKLRQRRKKGFHQPFFLWGGELIHNETIKSKVLRYNLIMPKIVKKLPCKAVLYIPKIYNVIFEQ